MSGIEFIDYGFKVCRACLTPGTVTQLSTIFDQNNEIARNFFHLFGLELSGDFGLHPALVCEGCLTSLNTFLEMRKKVRFYEEMYFQPYREAHEEPESVETSSKIDENSSMTRVDEMKTSIQLKRRGKIIPKPKKSKVCPQCKKTYASYWGMEDHVKSVHMKVKRFFCGLCQHSSFYQRNVQKHSLSKHKVK